MEVEYHSGEEMVVAEEGWQMPRREDCHILGVPLCSATPPRKKVVVDPGAQGQWQSVTP
jgi:hypothetical protein